MKDYFGYQEKVVIVTGASSGMGKATAEILVDLGAKVYALDWNACDVKGIEKFVQVDLSKKDSINQAMKELPKHVDSFFGIAGVSGMKNDFMTTVSIDFIANKYICEEYLIHSMTENGTIAFMTSTGGNGWEKEILFRCYCICWMGCYGGIHLENRISIFTWNIRISFCKISNELLYSLFTKEICK